VSVTNERGFSVVEVVVAIVILSVGLMGLVSTGALVTRMITRGQRSAIAANYAGRRLEMLRPAACIPAQRVNGSEVLYKGSVAVSTNTWTFTAADATTFRIRLFASYTTTKGKVRTDVLETTVACRT